MIAIVCGPRTLTDYNFIRKHLDLFFSDIKDEIEIVSGGAPGVDSCGERYSLEILGKQATVFDAEWKKFGKMAGPIRNSQMAGYLVRESISRQEEIVCIAFRESDRNSKGTSDMIKKARMQDVPVYVIRHGG